MSQNFVVICGFLGYLMVNGHAGLTTLLLFWMLNPFLWYIASVINGNSEHICITFEQHIFFIQNQDIIIMFECFSITTQYKD